MASSRQSAADIPTSPDSQNGMAPNSHAARIMAAPMRKNESMLESIARAAGDLPKRLIEIIGNQPVEKQAAIIADALAVAESLAWKPLEGSQTAAYFCPADITGYGGEAGGGKTALLVGLATTAHEKSLILRGTAKEAQRLADSIETIVGHRNGLNTSAGIWRLPGRIIEFGGCEHPGDEQKWKGRGHDLLAFDEVVDFSRYAFEFLCQWNRLDNPANPNQRCRVLATFNPPTRPGGMWVLDYFGAWINPRHPQFPTPYGQLRWYTTVDGEDTEVDGPGPHFIDGERIFAKSRTFIRGHLSENPYLEGYDATRAAAPKALRSAYRAGNFEAALSDAPGQLIPSAWVRAAQERWTKRPPVDVPQCAIGVDCTGGGTDPMILAPRHDGWFAPLIEVKGEEMELERMGSQAAGIVVSHRRDESMVVVDLGGGYGGSLYERLSENGVAAHAYKGAEKCNRRTADRKLGFVNVRSASYWAFREALDPDQPGGSPVALPDDPKLYGDLTAPTFEVTARGIKLEAKEDVAARLGRSPDRGDAVVMAWAGGPSYVTQGNDWREAARIRQRHRQAPKVRRW